MSEVCVELAAILNCVVQMGDWNQEIMSPVYNKTVHVLQRSKANFNYEVAHALVEIHE